MLQLKVRACLEECRGFELIVRGLKGVFSNPTYERGDLYTDLNHCLANNFSLSEFRESGRPDLPTFQLSLLYESHPNFPSISAMPSFLFLNAFALRSLRLELLPSNEVEMVLPSLRTNTHIHALHLPLPVPIAALQSVLEQNNSIKKFSLSSMTSSCTSLNEQTTLLQNLSEALELLSQRHDMEELVVDIEQLFSSYSSYTYGESVSDAVGRNVAMALKSVLPASSTIQKLKLVGILSSFVSDIETYFQIPSLTHLSINGPLLWYVWDSLASSLLLETCHLSHLELHFTLNKPYQEPEPFPSSIFRSLALKSSLRVVKISGLAPRWTNEMSEWISELLQTPLQAVEITISKPSYMGGPSSLADLDMIGLHRAICANFDIIHFEICLQEESSSYRYSRGDHRMEEVCTFPEVLSRNRQNISRKTATLFELLCYHANFTHADPWVLLPTLPMYARIGEMPHTFHRC